MTTHLWFGQATEAATATGTAATNGSAASRAGAGASGSPGESGGDGAPATAFEGTEHFNGNTLLVEAYAAIWVVLMAWILILWRKQATMSVRLDELERTLDRAAAAADAKAAGAAAAAGAVKASAKPKAAS